MLNIIQNILLGISLAAPVGPVNIEVIKRGLKYGFLPAFLLSLGAAAADTTYLLTIFFGLSKIINFPAVRTGIWFLGSLVLLYLGISSVIEFFDTYDYQKSNQKVRKNSFVAGYLITISNPMTIIWWFGIFGAIIGSSDENVSETVALLKCLTIIIGVVLWLFTLSLLLQWGKRFINEKNLKFISLAAGLIITGFGLYFGYNALTTLF